MPDVGYYIAYPAPQELQREARNFIGLMKEKNPKKQDKLLSHLMILLVNETINVYLTNIINTPGLSGTHKKLIETADSFIKKTAGVLIKQAIKKLDIEQQKKTAEHLDSCLLSLEREDRQMIDFVAYPVTKQFYQQIISGHNTFLETGSDAEKSIIIDNQKAITDQMVYFLIERLIAIINFGPILKKLINAGVEKSVQLMHSTVEKTFTAMAEDEMTKTNQHFASMLVIGPVHDSMNSPTSP